MQERFYFGDTVLPLFESGIPLVKRKLSSLPDADNITIAYPDEGSWKRFHYQFGEYPEVSIPNLLNTLRYCMLSLGNTSRYYTPKLVRSLTYCTTKLANILHAQLSELFEVFYDQ